jgi:hypothetical protein
MKARASRPVLILLFILVLSLVHRGAGGRGISPGKGTKLPNLLAMAHMRNAPVGAPPAQDGWILYAFSPLSPKSEKNQARVEKLARSLPDSWVLLAVAAESQGVPAFVERHHVTVPVLTQIPAKVLSPYKIVSTPRTYILDKDWKLIEVLEGPFEGRIAKKLAERFPPAGKQAPAPAPAPPGGKPLPSSLCRDRQQGLYSRGADAEVLGLKMHCGEGGFWVPGA